MSGDTIIIGAGPVGLFLAMNLVRANRAVIVIESGGRVPDTQRNSETATSIGKRHDGALLGRATGLGGTSVLWGGQLAEFEEEDLFQRGTEWPIAYEELRYWYDRVYEMLGIIDRLPADEYQRAFGGNSEPHPSVERFFTFWLPQPNFAKLFRHELNSSRLLTIMLHANVNRIVFDGDLAQEVWATSSSGRRIRVTGNKFVFAGGTIANNRFFLTSQRLFDVPWKFSELIGRYFQDHLIGKVADVEILNERRLREFFENGFVNKIKLQPKLRLTSQARKRVPVGVCGFFCFSSRIGDNVAKIKGMVRALKSGSTFSAWRSFPIDLWRLSGAFLPLIIRYARDRRVRAFFDKALEFHVQVEQVPVSFSRIRLVDSTPGPDGLFRAGVDWHLDGHEIDAACEFVTQADSYLRAQGIARLRIDPLLLQRNRSFVDRLSDNFHQCGGLRMAAAPRDGVTDSNCRVWETANVYVAGASVFPSSSHANCTLTALALAARLANTIGTK